MSTCFADQTPGIIDDRYPLTQILRTKAACQHINVNPFDLTVDPITDNLLIEQSTPDGDTRLIPATDSRYYDYSISDFEKKRFKNLWHVMLKLYIKN